MGAGERGEVPCARAARRRQDDGVTADRAAVRQTVEGAGAECAEPGQQVRGGELAAAAQRVPDAAEDQGEVELEFIEVYCCV